MWYQSHIKRRHRCSAIFGGCNTCRRTISLFWTRKKCRQRWSWRWWFSALPLALSIPTFFKGHSVWPATQASKLLYSLEDEPRCIPWILGVSRFVTSLRTALNKDLDSMQSQDQKLGVPFQVVHLLTSPPLEGNSPFCPWSGDASWGSCCSSLGSWPK